MDIRVSGKQIEIGEVLPTQVRRRLAAAVEKHFSGMAEANVTIAHEGTMYRADCIVHLGSGVKLATQGVGTDAYKAVNEAIEKVEKRVRRYKRKIKNHHHEPRAQQIS